MLAVAAGIADTGTHVGRHFASTTLMPSGKASVADLAAMPGHDPSVFLSTCEVTAAEGQGAASSSLGLVLEQGDQWVRVQSRDSSSCGSRR